MENQTVFPDNFFSKLQTFLLSPTNDLAWKPKMLHERTIAQCCQRHFPCPSDHQMAEARARTRFRDIVMKVGTGGQREKDAEGDERRGELTLGFLSSPLEMDIFAVSSICSPPLGCKQRACSQGARGEWTGKLVHVLRMMHQARSSLRAPVTLAASKHEDWRCLKLKFRADNG